MRDRILASLLRALDRADVRRRPFPHAALREVFPEDVYDELLGRLPPAEAYVPDNPAKYRLPDGTVARGVLGLGPAGLARVPEADRALWSEVASALLATELRARVFGLLGRRASAAHASPSLVRDLPGYWIEPHPDSPAKLVTLQLYLPRDASQERLGTSLYRLRPWDLANLVATGRPLVEFHRFPFLPRRGYAFAVGLVSWHGVERIPEGAGVRDSILLVYYKDPERAAG